MRLALLAVAFAAPLVVACSGDESPGVAGLDTHRPAGNGTASTGDPNGGAATNGATTDTAPCAGVADAKSVSADGDASDLQLTDGAVFYRTGAKVMRAPKDGGATAKLYESPNLVRSFVIGGGAIATMETADVDTTTIMLVSADQDQPAQATTTNWNAGGSYFFGADTGSVYAVADVPNGGEIVYQLPLAIIAAMREIAQADDVISSAQVTDAGVWYVRDRNRVFNVTFDAADPAPVNGGKPGITTTTASAPREVFGVTSSCGLAVGTANAFCSEGAMLEQRELSGASPRTLLEAAKSKVPSPFGKAVWSDGTLYIASSAADAKTGYTIRAIKPNGGGAVEERIVACGRTAIGEIAVDKENVVWTESGKGVFLAPR